MSDLGGHKYFYYEFSRAWGFQNMKPYISNSKLTGAFPFSMVGSGARAEKTAKKPQIVSRPKILRSAPGLVQYCFRE